MAKKKPLYILTLNGKPVTLGKALKKAKEHVSHEAEHDLFVCAPTRRAVRDTFIYNVGFTFPEWKRDGFNIVKKAA